MALKTSGNDHLGRTRGNNIICEIGKAILQATIPVGIDNPNTVVQVCVYLFQNSGDGFEFNGGTNIIVSFYDIPDIEVVRFGRKAVNLNWY